MHHSVDDAPYGGGPGMVMKAPVWGEALDEICTPQSVLVVPTPPAGYSPRSPPSSGQPNSTWSSPAVGTRALTIASLNTLPPVCASRKSPSATTCWPGEAAALVMIEAVVRLIPNVLGNPLSNQDDSHAPEQDGLLEGPVTRALRCGEVWGSSGAAVR